MSHTKKLVLARDQIRAEEERLNGQSATLEEAGNVQSAAACDNQAKGLRKATAIIEKLMRD